MTVEKTQRPPVATTLSCPLPAKVCHHPASGTRYKASQEVDPGRWMWRHAPEGTSTGCAATWPSRPRVCIPTRCIWTLQMPLTPRVAYS